MNSINSLGIREAKVKIIDCINSIPLPLEVTRLILKEVMEEVTTVTAKEIDALLKERENAEKSDGTVLTEKEESNE